MSDYRKAVLRELVLRELHELEPLIREEQIARFALESVTEKLQIQRQRLGAAQIMYVEQGGTITEAGAPVEAEWEV
jgi:hypothetical protein